MSPHHICSEPSLFAHCRKGREGKGREGNSLLTSANADTRGRAMNGQRVSDDPSPAPLRRDAGKDEARSRWFG